MSAKKIILVANTAWNLWNYRLALIRALRQEGYTVLLAAPADHFVPLLEAESGTPFIPLQWLSRKSYSPVLNFRLLLEFARLFQREQPAAVLLFTIKPNILGNLAARWAGVPSISVVEGLGYSGSAAARWRWLAGPLYRLALQATRRVIFLNQDDRREFLERRLIQESQAQWIHGPGVDTHYFQPAGAPASKRVVFLFSGRLLTEKGICEFAEAARILRHEDAPAVFRVLGAPDPGNPTSVLPATCEAWAKAGALDLLGHTDDVRPALAQADVLVLPSFYREGIPRSVLEAMAMGKIIITSDTPGCRDTVEDSQTGFLVPPRDTGALVAVMRRVLELSEEQRLQMGALGRAKALAEFSDAQVLPQYLRLIADVTHSG